MDFELSQKASIWAAVAVVALIVGGYGIISGLSYLKNQGIRLNDQKAVYESKNQQLSKLQDYQNNLSKAEEIVAVMNEALPVEKEKVSSITILDNIASQSGAKLSNISLTSDGTTSTRDYESDEGMLSEGEESLSPDVPEITQEQLTVTLVGNFGSIKSFLKNLEVNRRPFNPQTLEMTKDSAAIGLTAYYLK